MHDILKMCSFEGTKSTKGASKMRRDLLNAEIGQLRELLPLPPSTRQRLSQLQLMALVCVYVRKSNYFQQVLKQQATRLASESANMEFLKALNGFLIMMTQGGKLLYISDNAAEYLGHSMEDLLIHGDSVFDILDKQDHAAVQAELVRAAQAGPEDDRLFLCRMNVSRNARRQMRFGDQKVVLVHGHFLSYLPLCSRNEPVFLAHCSPVAMPETRESVVQGATNVFTTLHTLDMKIISIDKNGEFYLGYNKSSLAGVSWYHLIHPDNLRDAQTKHRLITSSEQERSCILLLRLQAAGGAWRWVHCVLQLKDAQETSTNSTATAATSATAAPTATATVTSGTQPQIPSTSSSVPVQNVEAPSPVIAGAQAAQAATAQPAQPLQNQQQPIIVATNQVLSEREAAVLRSNSWLYHYYTMQSKLQYGLAYEAQRVHAYYPQVMPYQTEAAGSYMATNPLASTHYQQQFNPTTHSSHYPLSTSYLHPYHAHYSLRLHSEYSRDSSQSYYDYSSPAAHNYVYNYSNGLQTTAPVPEAMSPAPSLTPKSRRSTPMSSPKRSPVSHGLGSTDGSGGVAVATPVAVRPSPHTQIKGGSPMSVDESELSWKSSPNQEVPECPEYTPYVTPPYSTTASPTKSTHFSFDNSPEASDQYVPSPHIDPREAPWYSHAFVR